MNGAAPPPPPPVASGCSAGGAGTAVASRTVEVSLEDPRGSGEYTFDPSELTFDVGETVTFVLRSETDFHTFTIDGLDIDVDIEGGLRSQD